MNCKVCNTRIRKGNRNCPNCGNEAPAGGTFEPSAKPGPLPAPDLSTARDGVDDLSSRETRAPAPVPTKAKKTKRSRKASPAKASGSAPLFAPDAASLRTLLAEQPEALEPGLNVLRDDKGAPIGAGYASGVGEIDLLAEDAQGELVVVLVSQQGAGEELVAEVLQRIGWVRKHVGEGERQVRGIVLCEGAPEDLGYAATAVADRITFKTYRVALTFEDLAL
ncbi:MAG: hypothetical protein VX546_09440 [Myxococcota bacterium]|nr:hypothetical protein [Myxococcota bacterium]